MPDERLLEGLKLYIREHYVPIVYESVSDSDNSKAFAGSWREKNSFRGLKESRSLLKEVSTASLDLFLESAAVPVADRSFIVDEGFAEMLFRLIDEKEWTDPQFYNKAGIDRRHFSKFRNEENYHPQKTTVIRCCLALELDKDRASELMMKAGYAFSNADLRDVIVSYCIENNIYDPMLVNEYLLDNDAQLI